MNSSPQTIFEIDAGISLSHNKHLKIIHFNDVYNIEGQTKEPLGGAARFLTLIKYLKSSSPCLVLFSGDAFSPSSCKLSIMKKITKDEKFYV